MMYINKKLGLIPVIAILPLLALMLGLGLKGALHFQSTLSTFGVFPNVDKCRWFCCDLSFSEELFDHRVYNPLQAITGDIYLITEELKTMPENESKTGSF